MIRDIISLAKESEQRSKEVVIEKRRGDLLLYDVSMRRKIHLFCKLLNSEFLKETTVMG